VKHASAAGWGEVMHARRGSTWQMDTKRKHLLGFQPKSDGKTKKRPRKPSCTGVRGGEAPKTTKSGGGESVVCMLALNQNGSHNGRYSVVPVTGGTEVGAENFEKTGHEARLKEIKPCQPEKRQWTGNKKIKRRKSLGDAFYDGRKNDELKRRGRLSQILRERRKQRKQSKQIARCAQTQGSNVLAISKEKLKIDHHAEEGKRKTDNDRKSTPEEGRDKRVQTGKGGQSFGAKNWGSFVARARSVGLQHDAQEKGWRKITKKVSRKLTQMELEEQRKEQHNRLGVRSTLNS